MMSRLFRFWYARIVLSLSLLWLVFVVALDIRYEMMPRTTLGGLKILIVGWIVAFLLYVGFRLIKSRAGKRV
ncbi:MAG: hypothetical protein ACI9MJ_001080 [Alphaproteobacteria bacterium]|jgi:hypothetical protein